MFCIVHGSPQHTGITTALVTFFSKIFTKAPVLYTCSNPQNDDVSYKNTNNVDILQHMHIDTAIVEAISSSTSLNMLEKEQYATFLQAKYSIFIAPIYFYGIPACAKNFVDKANFLYTMQYKTTVERFFFPVLHAGSNATKELFTGALLTLRYFSKVCGFQMQEPLLLANTDTISMLDNTEQLESYCAGIQRYMM